MKLAVLGLGSAGRRHAGNLRALGHEVVGWDPEPAWDLPGVSRANSVEEAIAACAAVVVASPSSAHADQARAALEAGRDVLVEKPLATSAPDAEALAALAERTGRTCAVAMNMRFHPALRRLKELVANGALGKVLLACASFGHDLRLWRPENDYRRSYSARAELGGGIVLDAIHELDYLLWVLGPADAVSAETGKLSELEVDVEDVAAAVVRFRSGALATVDLNFFEQSYRRGCVLAGTGATAHWDWSAARIAISDRDESRTEEISADVGDTYRAELADFADAVRIGRPPLTSAADGVAAVRLAEAI